MEFYLLGYINRTWGQVYHDTNIVGMTHSQERTWGAR